MITSIETATYLQLIGYLLFIVTPIVFFFSKGLSRKPHFVLMAYLASVLTMYMLIAAPLANLNGQLDLISQSLDRDGDGVFSPEEEASWTDSEKRAYDMHIADGARNVFGYLLSPLFASLYAAVIFSTAHAGRLLVLKTRAKQTGSTPLP